MRNRTVDTELKVIRQIFSKISHPKHGGYHQNDDILHVLGSVALPFCQLLEAVLLVLDRKQMINLSKPKVKKQ